uniref:Mannosyltransferase n=1 Tax=Megaselia scalaris TaxID=36166 RepID=T1GTR5_MEGSC
MNILSCVLVLVVSALIGAVSGTGSKADFLLTSHVRTQTIFEFNTWQYRAQTFHLSNISSNSRILKILYTAPFVFLSHLAEFNNILGNANWFIAMICSRLHGVLSRGKSQYS